MTGIELMVMLGGTAALMVSAITLSMFRQDREQTRFVEALAGFFDVLQEERGNLDRPLALLLRGRDASVEVEAILRGEHELWHLRQEGIQAPALGALGCFVVVDVEWVEAVRRLRDLHFIDNLSPRYALFGAPTLTRRAFDDVPGARHLVASLRDPTPAKCLVVEPNAAGVRVFLELPRDGLHAEHTRHNVERLHQLVAILEGRGGPLTTSTRPRLGTHPPSGAPCGVPTG